MLALNYRIDSVEAIKQNTKYIGRFTFSGEGIIEAQQDYFTAKAMVNVLAFKKCYTQIFDIVNGVRKTAREAEKNFLEVSK